MVRLRRLNNKNKAAALNSCNQTGASTSRSELVPLDSPTPETGTCWFLTGKFQELHKLLLSFGSPDRAQMTEDRSGTGPVL